MDSNFRARETQDYAPFQRQATNNQTTLTYKYSSGFTLVTCKAVNRRDASEKGQRFTITASSLTKIDRHDDLTFKSVTMVSDTKIRSVLRTNQITGCRFLLEKNDIIISLQKNF